MVDCGSTYIPDIAVLENCYFGDSNFFFAKKQISLPSIEYKAKLHASSRDYVTEIRV